MIKIIFMIDDDQDDRELFKEAVSSCYPDIEVLFTVDGDEALEILKNSPVNPDAIFLDYHMPRMTGLDCLRALKDQEKTKSIPVIMYTMGAHPDIEEVTLTLGADHYMKKANSFSDLCNDLTKVLASLEEKITGSASATG